MARTEARHETMYESEVTDGRWEKHPLQIHHKNIIYYKITDLLQAGRKLFTFSS